MSEFEGYDNCPEYPIEPADPVAELIRSVRVVLQNDFSNEAWAALTEAVEGVEALYESDDPVQMGWVGRDGRP